MKMMNPMQILKGMGNPQQFIQNMMGNSQIMSNPMAKNIMGMAQKGDFAGVEQLGRNIAKEKGIDFDQAFTQFRNQFPR